MRLRVAKKIVGRWYDYHVRGIRRGSSYERDVIARARRRWARQPRIAAQLRSWAALFEVAP